MLRVGLTGDLGSGKSTVAVMLAARGAVVFSSDEMARTMTQPGQVLYAAIVARFGREVIAADGTLDRRKLAQMAFDPAAPQVAALNALIHPAVIAEQARLIAPFATTGKIVVVESALIFSAAVDFAWKDRFDRIVLVTAPEAVKVARFVQRSAGGHILSVEEQTALEDDARRRLTLQNTERFAAECLVVHNDRGLAELESRVETLWAELQLPELSGF